MSGDLGVRGEDLLIFGKGAIEVGIDLVDHDR